MIVSIKVSEENFRSWLALLASPNEEACFGVLSWWSNDGDLTFWVRQLFEPSPVEIVYQDGGSYELSRNFIIDKVLVPNKAALQETCFLDLHIHPPHCAFFSHRDNRCVPNTIALAKFIAGVRYYIRLVIAKGTADIVAEYVDLDHWADDTQPILWQSVDRVEVYGSRQYQRIATINSAAISEDEEPVQFWARHQRTGLILSPSKLSLLHSLRVAVVGLGGLGVCAVAGLRSFFNRFLLCDGDRLSIENLNRWWAGSLSDLGRFKGDILHDMLLAFDPENRVDVINSYLEPPFKAHGLLASVDLIIGCLDNDESRYELTSLAARYAIPYFDCASGIIVDEHNRVRASGTRVTLFRPGGPCLFCQIPGVRHSMTSRRAIAAAAEAGYAGNGESPASTSSFNLVSAGLLVRNLLAYFVGYGDYHCPRHTQYEEADLFIISYPDQVPNPSCELCGAAVLGLGSGQAIESISLPDDIADAPPPLDEEALLSCPGPQIDEEKGEYHGQRLAAGADDSDPIQPSR